MTYSISIVIATKDRPRELDTCLRHIDKQSSPLDAVVVVDASEDDRSAKVIASLTPTFSWPLTRIPSEPGIAGQRKTGVEQCTSEIVLFVDDDVYLDDTFVAEMLGTFETLPWSRIGGITGSDKASSRKPCWSLQRIFRRLFFLQDYGSGRFKLSGLHTTANGRRGTCKVEYMGGAFTAYRRSVLLEIPPDEVNFSHAFEDVDLAWRVSQVYQNYYTDRATCVHEASPINRPPSDERSQLILDAYKRFWENNIPKTALRRWAHLRACKGLQLGISFMTNKDLICFVMESILGKRSADALRARFRRRENVQLS